MYTSSSATGFSGLGIAPKLLEAIERLGFATPTPIQSKAIPIAIEGKDLIGIAQTGTGKTLAFGVPMLQRLAQVKGRGLVVLPTRELAIQVDEALHTVGRSLGLRTAVLIGGASMYLQTQALKGNPHIIVVTPGRLLDHLEQGSVKLHDVCILILDEADRMLDMGFQPQIRKILAAVPRERQTMLFSATMPDEIFRIATHHMKLPVRIEIARSGTAPERVDQEVFVVEKSDKSRLLEKILGETRGSVLVFTRTKHLAKKLTRSVKSMGHAAAEIHSNRSLAQRRDALEGFKSGKYRVLIATDIAARGIDVTGIELVVQYDLPSTAEDYVHRIGRTARAGNAGKAISFAMPDERSDLKAIERLIRRSLRVSPLPELPPGRAPTPPPTPSSPYVRGGGGRWGTRSQPSRPSRGGFQRPQHGGQRRPSFHGRRGGPGRRSPRRFVTHF